MLGDGVGGQDRVEGKWKKNHLYTKHTLHDDLMLRGLNSDVMKEEMQSDLHCSVEASFSN